MRKRYILILSLVSLLLTGCLGGTSTNYIYDGSPTTLEVVIKRDAPQVAAMSAMSDEEEPSKVQVRIWRTNDEGQVIYSVYREIPIYPTKTTYTLNEELPAQPGYKITAMYANHGGFFEIAEQEINAPAERVTTANIALVPLRPVVHVPDIMYSGGSLEQIWVEFPKEYDHLLDYMMGLDFSLPVKLFYDSAFLKDGYLPEVKEPAKMYYQVIVFAKDGTYKGDRPMGHFLESSNGENLPYITVIPSPSYTKATQ